MKDEKGWRIGFLQLDFKEEAEYQSAKLDYFKKLVLLTIVLSILLSALFYKLVVSPILCIEKVINDSTELDKDDPIGIFNETKFIVSYFIKSKQRFIKEISS